MIRFEQVSIRYPGARADAVADLSLTANRRAITAVVGPNGSGKTTLVRALLGRANLRGGAIHLDNDDLAALSRSDVARRVATVTQREELAFPTTVRDYVALGRYPHVGLWKELGAADREQLAEAMQSAAVADLVHRSIDSLSGGEWQRVRIARALAQGGDALVLDEPTTFLDIGHEMEIFELLNRLRDRGMAVLLVSHQINLVARFADVIAVLHRGRAVAVGSPRDAMRPAVLERVYDWPLAVSIDPASGAPTVLPLRKPH